MISPVLHAQVFYAAPSRFPGVVDVVLKGEIGCCVEYHMHADKRSLQVPVGYAAVCRLTPRRKQGGREIDRAGSIWRNSGRSTGWSLIR